MSVTLGIRLLNVPRKYSRLIHLGEASPQFASTTNILIRRLVLLKFLKEQDKTNQSKIAEAKSKFKAKYGFDVQNQIYKNTLQFEQFPKTRQGIRQYVQKSAIQSAGMRQIYERLGEEQQRTTDKTNMLEFESLDLYDAPHFQQVQLENHYMLDEIYKQRANNGILTKQGSSNYWKALDDSNDVHNIEKVQKQIGDERPTDFRIKNSEVVFEFDKNGNVVDIHKKQDSKKNIH